ncbi:MAG: hypothetical protein DMG21_03890 [Acidobacteria bacterium]|nr:MAG: hypothetical protein DMG21_03890 [Acidobacteriota bacterium]
MPFESGHGAKVLIVADDANGERPLQTFLSSMGCSCTVATARELATAEAARRTFDAVLLDLRYSARPAERLTSFVEGMPLSLKERTLLISSDRPDAQTMNLADRYSLPRLTENRLIFGVWDNIQKLLALPRIEHPATKGERIAWILFDSFRRPAPPGTRGSSGSTRQFAYQHDDVIVDIAIEPVAESGRISLVGQIMDRRSGKGPNISLPVTLTSRKGPVARAQTNPMGEFVFEFEFVPDVEMEFQTDAGTWVLIQLPSLNWIRERLPLWAAG